MVKMNQFFIFIKRWLLTFLDFFPELMFTAHNTETPETLYNMVLGNACLNLVQGGDLSCSEKLIFIYICITFIYIIYITYIYIYTYMHHLHQCLHLHHLDLCHLYIHLHHLIYVYIIYVYIYIHLIPATKYWLPCLPQFYALVILVGWEHGFGAGFCGIGSWFCHSVAMLSLYLTFFTYKMGMLMLFPLEHYYEERTYVNNECKSV